MAKTLSRNMRMHQQACAHCRSSTTRDKRAPAVGRYSWFPLLNQHVACFPDIFRPGRTIEHLLLCERSETVHWQRFATFFEA
jgi:hypothetical protein